MWKEEGLGGILEGGGVGVVIDQVVRLRKRKDSSQRKQIRPRSISFWIKHRTEQFSDIVTTLKMFQFLSNNFISQN